MVISGAEEYSALVRVPDDSQPVGFLEGELLVPWDAYAIAIVAHGSGSNRFSPRNRLAATILRSFRIGTFLIDLSAKRPSASETTSQSELETLASRIIASYRWLQNNPMFLNHPVGLFGSGAGGAAGLIASALCPNSFEAIVLRSAHLELAGSALALVRPPTLLIAGSKDVEVVGQYRDHIDSLGCATKRFELVPGVGRSFEEPGALAAVALKASHWFEKFLMESESVPVSTTQRYAYLDTAADA